MLASIIASEPDWIGLSFLTMTYERAAWLASELKAALPDVPLVGGGAHCTADPAGALAELELDYVVSGEGEAVAVALTEALAAQRPLSRLPGLWAGEEPPPDQELVEHLDDLPFPARDLLQPRRYLAPPGLIRGWASSGIASMLASRGCPFACSFCASKQQLGRAVRIRSVSNVIAEIDDLVSRYQIRGLYFVDDVFTFHRDWVLAFCEALQSRPYRLHWACQARVNQVDEALLVAMRDAGCVQVDYGVESGSPRILKSMQKGIRREEVIEAFSLTHGVGMRTGASFVLGSPTETEEDRRLTADLARRIDSDWTVFFFSTPYPGTPLWRRTRGYQKDYPEYGEAWNNRVTQRPFPQGAEDGEELVGVRATLQNHHFRKNYLHARNLPFILRLTSTLRSSDVRRSIGRVVTRTGRLDDVVEAAFSTWRAGGQRG